VSIHKQLKVLIEDELSGLFPTGFRVVADPATEKSLSEVVRQTPERILLAVGPEGGWNTFEMNLFKAHQLQTGGLGPRTLRTDTACVAALAIVHDAMNSGRPQV
jgi:RsmE family RNA methyltransferase